MHFCESFNSVRSGGTGAGTDTFWTVLQGAYSQNGSELEPFICNWPNRMMQGEPPFPVGDIGGTDGPDQFFRVQINEMGTSSYISLLLRCADVLAPSQTFYAVSRSKYPGLADGGAFVRIDKFINASGYGSAGHTVLVSAVTVPFTRGEIFKATVEGTTIRAYINGVQVATATDSGIDGVSTHAGLGIETWLDCSTGFGTFKINDAFGGDLAEEDECEDGGGGGGVLTPGVPLSCGRPFTVNPCAQECPTDPESTSVEVELIEFFASALGFRTALLPLALASPQSVAAALPVTCGRTFTNNLPSQECP